MAGEIGNPDIKPDQLVSTKRRVTRSDLADLVKIAKETKARIVHTAAFGAEDPDDWCGTMWHRGPHVGPVIDLLIDRGWIITHVFPYGIPVIDGVMIGFANQIRSNIR